MSTFFGTDTITSIKHGSTNVTKAYLGTQLVYQENTVAPSSWLPTQITGLQCWLDATDHDTLYDNDHGNLGQWVDRTGNGHEFTQPLVTQQPVWNGTDTVTFDGGDRLVNDTLQFDDAYIWGDTTTGHSVFVVAKSTGDDVSRLLASPQEPRFLFGGGVSTGDNNFMVAYGHTTRNYNSTSVLTPVNSLSSVNILGVVNTQDTQTTPYYNGQALDTIDGQMTAFTGLNIGAGSYSVVDGTWSGDVHEIVIFDLQLSSPDREKVEGYLAWKWNLVDKLATAHAYKLAPPY